MVVPAPCLATLPLEHGRWHARNMHANNVEALSMPILCGHIQVFVWRWMSLGCVGSCTSKMPTGSTALLYTMVERTLTRLTTLSMLALTHMAITTKSWLHILSPWTRSKRSLQWLMWVCPYFPHLLTLLDAGIEPQDDWPGNFRDDNEAVWILCGWVGWCCGSV